VAESTPASVSFSPWRRLAADLREQRQIEAGLPPGPRSYSLRRTRRFLVDPLPILLSAYEEFGPVFTVRVLYQPVVFALGPEANHAILVRDFDAFRWRSGAFRDLIPLLGNGLLTIDGPYHRLARGILLPGFARERLEAAAATTLQETDRALGGWRPGDRVDIERWARTLALRIALRALLGLDPDYSARGMDLAAEWERALAFYGRDYVLQVLRGPRTPWRDLRSARARIDGMLAEEIAVRRSQPRGADLLSLLLEARDEEDRALSDAEVRDQLMTVLFAGHDTATSTVSFLMYELARHPTALARVAEELADVEPSFDDLASGLPELDRAVDETLRLYPPAWVGPRRAVRDVELGGHRIPAGAHVNYCSYASHRLPEVFPDPEAFVPERWSEEARSRLPRGAYVPFGGGSRTCIGMRFGKLEVKAIAARVLQNFRLELPPGHRVEIRQTPTLGPRGGLPMTVRRSVGTPARRGVSPRVREPARA
jgi:cytochrome P450